MHEFRSPFLSISRRWSALAVLICLGLVALLSAQTAQAQTAHFSGTVVSLGGYVQYPNGVAIDTQGTVYAVNQNMDSIYEIPRGCMSSGCAKSVGSYPSGFYGIAIDKSGNMYVTDISTASVYEIPVGCTSGSCEKSLGTGWGQPSGIALDGAGNLYVTDSKNGEVYEMPVTCTSAACMKTLPGTYGYPYGVAVDASGNVYVADYDYSVIHEIPAGCTSSSCIKSLGGGFSSPDGVGVDSQGNVFVADLGNNKVKEIPPACTSQTCVKTLPGSYGEVSAAVPDEDGNVYVGDFSGNSVKEIMLHATNFYTEPVGSTSAADSLTFTIDTAGTLGAPVTLTEGAPNLDFAVASGGTCTSGASLAAGATCTVNVTFTPKYPGLRKGAVELTNSSGAVIATAYVYGTGTGPQAAFPPGTISTVAGNGTAGSAGDGGPATSANLYEPYDVAVDAAGNLYIADTFNNRVREVNATTGVITTVAGNGTGGYSGDGGAATSAWLSAPLSVAVDGAGNFYIADAGNNRIREVNVATGIITTVAGNGTAGFSGDGGPATSAELNYPDGLAVDGAGNLYIADSRNNRVREVNSATGVITTVAGNGTAGFSGDGGPATSAELNYPDGLAMDAAGKLYISDGANQRVREVNAAGVITTVAGNGIAGYSGDGGAATSAKLYDPSGVAVDAAGNLYIADRGNNRIREVNASTGIIITAAGNGTGSYSGDGGPATSAELNQPYGLAVGGAGNLYIADTANNRIRKTDVATPPSLSFVTTLISTTSSDSPQTVTVQNNGNGTLTFPIPASGYNPSVSANFTYDNSSTCTQNGSGAATAFTLASGASCTMAIDFSPTLVGSITGTTVLTDDSLNAASPNYTTQSITLSGSATKAATTVALTSSTSNANLNANLTFTAMVTSATSGTPTGEVEFLDGSTVLGSGPLNNSGTATYTTSTLTAGQHSITAVYQGDANYNGSTSAALAQTVTAPAYSLSSNKTSLTLKEGQTGQFTISLVPVGGFKGDVQFTCSGLPTLSQCTFSPSSLTADGSNTTQTSTLTITTKGSNSGTVSMLTPPGKPDGIMMAGIFWLPALFFGALLFWQRKKLTRKYRFLMILLLAAATISGAVGCGSSPHTAPGTSTVTVTGTSGSTTQTVTLNVDVTQ